MLSVIKWKGPKSNKLTSKFWKQMVYEMPVKQKEMLSRDQVKGQNYISRYILNPRSIEENVLLFLNSSNFTGLRNLLG